MFIVYLVCFLHLLYYYLTKNYSYWKNLGIPYDEPFLFFGSFFKVFIRKQHFIDNIKSIYNKYKTPYVGFYIFNQPNLVIRSPDLIKKVLVKDFDTFSIRNFASTQSDLISTNSLFAAKDSQWRNIRVKLTPVFTSGKMKLMFPLIKECGQGFVKYMKKMDGKDIETHNASQKYSVDVISSCAFGINSNSMQNDDSEIMKMATRLLDGSSFVRAFSIFCFFFVHRLVTIFRLSFVDKVAAKYLFDIFSETLKERRQRNIVRNDLIDLLDKLKEDDKLDDKFKFDEVKMASQAISFFSAGNDTTALTISYAFYELALHKDIQDKLRQEITESFNKEGDFTYESILDMKYLDMVLSEVMRRYPITGILNRVASTDYTFEETGLTVEKGTNVYISISGLHFDPQYFPNPFEFDPERFNDDNKKNIQPYTYLPFGDGPRVCIGQRFALLTAKVGIAYIVKEFMIEPIKTTSIPIKFNPIYFLLQSESGVHLKFSKI